LAWSGGVNVNQQFNFTYDPAGNLTSDGQNGYSYNSANQLVSYRAHPYGNSSQLDYTLNFEYDGLGNRIRRTNVLPQITWTTDYLLDLNTPLVQVLREIDRPPSTATNLLTTQRTFMLGLDVLGFEQKPLNGPAPSTWSFFGYDALGSVRQVYDGNDGGGDLSFLANFDPYGVPLEKVGINPSELGYTGEQTDPNSLQYLRARYMNPTTGTFLSRDPVEGAMNRLASRNGYGYAEGNPANDGVGELSISQSMNGYSYANGDPANLTDPSGACPFCIPLAIIGGALLGGFTYGSVRHLTTDNAKWAQGNYGGALGDAFAQGLLWGGGSALVAGGVTLGGAVLVGGAKLAGGALLSGAHWLAAHPIVAGGLIGGELEWTRQFSVNTANGMDVFHAGYRANLDGWKIAKAATFGAITGGVWNAAGVFSTYASQGIAGLAFSQMTSSVAAATVWGGILSAGSYVGSLVILNRVRNKSLLDDFTWADLFSSTAAGSTTNWLTAKAGIALNPKFSLNPHIDNLYKGGAYIGIGVAVGAGQAVANGAFDIVSNGQIAPNAACSTIISMGAGATNVGSLIQSPLRYTAASLVFGIAGNVRAGVCPVPNASKP
jgi:RHS repeat-associated protein